MNQIQSDASAPEDNDRIASLHLSAIDYRVIATLRTGTMEKELNDAAGAGFRFSAVMGGETAVGGKEVIG